MCLCVGVGVCLCAYAWHIMLYMHMQCINNYKYNSPKRDALGIDMTFPSRFKHVI